MFRVILEKELREILQSPKFVASFITFSVLILLSFYVGINEYRQYEKNYNTSISLMNSQISQSDSWLKVQSYYTAFRAPNPMQIFSSGIHNDLGRFSPINPNSNVKLRQSVFADEPLYAVFRYVDFTFIVTIILPLFAILFSFDAINGERENGTLKMIFSNSVPRNKYILAKFAGSWLGLVTSILIPILIGLLMLLIFNIPFTGGDWLKIAMLLLISLIYFSFFLAFGILVSSLTKASSTSFLVLLVSWIAFVFILPRVGIMTAGQFYNIPTDAMIESQKSAFRTQRMVKSREDLQAAVTKWQEEIKNNTKDMPKDQQTEYVQKRQTELQTEAESINKAVEADVTAFYEKLIESAQNAKDKVESLGLSLSRLSPASLYQLTAMNLCGTELDLKKRYESSMKEFRLKYNEYIQKKIAESGGTFALAQAFGRSGTIVDTKELPRFTDPVQTFSAAVAPSIIDISILIILTLAAFAGSYIAFLKYDLR